jgi:protein O-GlcNAc transferase
MTATVADQLAAAIALHQRGDIAGAERHYRDVLLREASNADALHLLGVVHMQQKRFSEAARLVEAAIISAGYRADFHNSASVLARETGRAADAVFASERAIKLRPTYAEAHANLGLALMEMARPADAVASFRRAIKLKPEIAAFYNNLGNAYRTLKQFNLAEGAYRAAISRQPRHVHALFGLGVVLNDQGRPIEAAAELRKAVALKGDFGEAHRQLGVIAFRLGRLTEGRKHIERALEINPVDPAAQSDIVFVRNYLDDVPPEEVRDSARRYAEALVAEVGPPMRLDNLRDPHRPIRIGFLSGDLGDSPVGQFTKAVLRSADRSHISFSAYNTRNRRIDMRAFFDRWRDVYELTDEEAAASIREDEIDILVDLAGFTSGSRARILAIKPAPIQVNWLGYSGTTGNPRVDYILVDRHVVPEHESHLYTEAAWRMPDSYLCWTEPDDDVPVAPPPSLERGSVTFGSFNNVQKLSNRALAVWASVLRAVPDSRLLIKSSVRLDPAAFARVRDIISGQGIDAERVGFIDRVPKNAQHLAHYHQIDIALDPFPYAGTTTTVEALFMGVPVVTHEGDRFISRVGQSLLTTVGRPEWIARDTEDYVGTAVALASDPAGLVEIRNELRAQVLESPLCDASRFATHLNDAFRQMWRNWCEEKA